MNPNLGRNQLIIDIIVAVTVDGALCPSASDSDDREKLVCDSESPDPGPGQPGQVPPLHCVTLKKR
jgi:hypothetical protein